MATITVVKNMRRRVMAQFPSPSDIAKDGILRFFKIYSARDFLMLWVASRRHPTGKVIK